MPHRGSAAGASRPRIGRPGAEPDRRELASAEPDPDPEPELLETAAVLNETGHMVSVTTIALGFVNAYLVRGDKMILVDTGCFGSEARILETIRKAGEDPAQLALIIVTHGHDDHYGSAAALREATGAPVACAERDAIDLQHGTNRHLAPLGVRGHIAAFLSRSGVLRRSNGIALAPDILFTGAESLSRWGVDASVLAVGGHTPGSLALVPGSETAPTWPAVPPALEWAIVGDLASGGISAPLSAALPFFASDARTLADSLKHFINTDTIYVGHGGPLRGADMASLSARAERYSLSRR